MQYIKIDYLDFVPGKILGQEDINNEMIYVFCYRQGKKIYKRKSRCIGGIGYRKDGKGYFFYPIVENCYGLETLMKIASVIHQLNEHVLVFDSEKGELKKCMSK